MNTNPYAINAHELTKKQLWLAAFTSLLCHMQPKEAVSAADEALELCDQRWQDPKWVETWQYSHNYPVGFVFTQPSDEKSSGRPRGL